MSKRLSSVPTCTTIVPRDLAFGYRRDDRDSKESRDNRDQDYMNKNHNRTSHDNRCSIKADCDKIEPYNIWLGGASAGMDQEFLEKNEISVIIDVGSFNIYDFKDTEHPFAHTCEKQKKEFEYVRIDISDDPSEKISVYFKQMNDLIDRSLEKNKNVLIHCECGISRSASLMIAYVMHKKNIDHRSALAYVKRFRSCIKPNSGFIQQLSKANM